MKLNCRPGDLAFVVRDACRENIGAMLRVTQLKYRSAGEPLWLFEDATRPLRVSELGHPLPIYVTHSHGSAAHPYNPIVFNDNDLRPIRNPGDDAVDESAAWLPPVPSRIKESA